MAKEVVRQDVVQISFDIMDNPLKDLLKELEDLKKTANGSVEGVEDSFKDLKDTTKSVRKGFSDIAKEKFTSLKNSLKNTKDNLIDIAKNATTKAVAGLKKIAQTSLAKLKAGLAAVKTKLTEIAKKAGGAAWQGLKRLAGISFRALAVGIGAATTAIGTLVAKSVSAFSEFEQYKGGMEKIFDKADTKTILKDANNAYKDLGMTVNQYLSAINNTGATFASTMGDQKGYDTARMGMKAISDYATGTGKNIDELNEKFTLITRSTSSYQSIADQFSGILPATSKEFLKQAKAAGFLKKGYSELTKVPIAEYQEAVAKMLEKGVAELGLAGNTAMEAEKTLSGSLGMVKSAWGNLITAIGSGENLDQTFDNFISSAEVFGVQLIPVVERALSGIGTVIEKLTPKIAEKIPQLAEDLTPPLIKAATALLKALIVALPDIVRAFAKEIPTILSELADAITEAFGINMSPIKDFAKYLSEHTEEISKAAPKIAGAIAAFFALKKVLPFVIGLFSKGSSGKGGFLANLGKQFAALGKTKSGMIAKGVANLAIIVGGTTLLAAACIAIMALTSKLADTKSMAQFVAIIGAFGAVGAALAKFAGTIGLIPISVVLKGLAAIALVMAGVTGIIVAFGALSKINGFNEFLQKGGDVLAKIFNIIGQIGGSLIGGLGEGITNSLPKMGQNISAFAESLKPMFTTFSNVGDMSGISTFLKAIADFMLKMAGNELASLFTGGTNLTKLATDLSSFAEGSAAFFTKVAELPKNGFTNATALFNCLAGLTKLPKDGGVMGWFSGEINYTNIANGLASMANESVLKFFTAVAGLEAKGFENAKLLFDCLAGLKALPKDGGVMGWFAGDVNYTNVANGLGALAGDGVKNFFAMVAGIDPSAFEKTKQLFAALSSMGDLPKEGGWWDKLTGTETSTIGNLANELSNFATKTQEFFNLVNTAQTENLTALSQGITKISESIANMQNVVKTSATAILATFLLMLTSIVTAINSVDLTDEGSQMINGLIVGMNSKKQAAVLTARSIANAINAEYRKIQDIHSPSRVWEKFGAYQIQGNINGIENNLPKLETAVQQAGESSMPRYAPESTTTTNNRTSYNTFNPSFTLNMNGASATDSNKRKVTKWVREAIKSTFDEMSRANPQLIEV